MRILFLAPQPFFQERGTPIAVNMLLREFAAAGHVVDVVTYHEGEDVDITHVTLHRIPSLRRVRNLRPGFSWKKLVCDWYVLRKAAQLTARQHYDLVYAVEESVFIALWFKRLRKLPYVYDMDSSLAQQLVEKFGTLRFAAPILNRIEALAIRNALLTVPVCDALAEVAARAAVQVITLRDAPLPAPHDLLPTPEDDLRAAYNITDPLALYVGNLERYQGIDLLLHSFALARRSASFDLVIIGGTPTDVEKYQASARQLGIDDRVHFAGAKPFARLGHYLSQADFLVSPRLRGVNTPMKLFHYLYSGKAIIATDLPTHTQVLLPSTAMLVAPTVEAFGEGLVKLAKNHALREAFGAAGRDLVLTRYSYDNFQQTAADILTYLEAQLQSNIPAGVATGEEVLPSNAI